MANFSALKTAIRNAIKQNGNEEITGDVLQQILLSIVSTMGDGAINTIEQNLSNETTTRQGADTQLQNAINAIKANIDNGYVYAGIAKPSTTPVSGKVFYAALQAGTYTNFGGTAVTEGITFLKYNGTSWTKEQVLFTDGGVFDISAYHATGGTLATYADLSAALGTNGANVPANVRKGGMSIKFVQSSDNKYVQYRYMGTSTANADFINVANWQGIDDIAAGVSKLGYYNGYMERGVEKVFFAYKGDNVTVHIEGQAEACVRFTPAEEGETYIYTDRIPSGGGSLDMTITLPIDVVGILAAFGNLTSAQIVRNSNINAITRNIDEKVYEYAAEEPSGNSGNIELSDYDFQVGNIDGQTGEPISSITNCIYSVPIHVVAGSVFSYSITNYRITLHEWDSRGNYIHNSGWHTNTGTVTLQDNTAIVKIVIGQLSGVSGTPVYSQVNPTFTTSNFLVKVIAASKKIVAKIEGNVVQLLKYSNYIGSIPRGVEKPFFAYKGDKIKVSIEGAAGAGIRFGNNSVYDKIIPSGSTSLETEFTLTSDIESIMAVYGNLTSAEVIRESNYDSLDKSIKENVNNYAAVCASGESGEFVLSDEDFNKGNILDDGTIDPSFNACIYSKLIPVVGGSTISYSITNYRLDIHQWDLYGNHFHTGWLTGTGSVTLLQNIKNIRFVIAQPSGGSGLPVYSQVNPTLISSDLSVFTRAASEKDFQKEVNKTNALLGFVEDITILRGQSIPFFAYNGYKIKLNIEGDAGAGIRFGTLETDFVDKLIPSGSTSLEEEFELIFNIESIQAVYGNVQVNRIIAERDYSKIVRIPIYAPSPQLPAGNESDADFDAENMTSAQLYAAYDAMIGKLAAPASQNTFSPKYATLNPVQGDDASGNYKLRTYVFTKRNRFAWKHANRLYAWKSANDNILYVDSCSPRIGDTLYSNTSRTNSGKTVSSYDCATQSIVASDNVTYYRYNDGNVKPDMYWSRICLNRTGNTSSTTIALYDKDDTNVGNATYIDSTHLLYDGKSYERCDAQDYHTNNKATIFIWANEHGPQSDPNECAITLYRLAKDLCIGCRNNNFISFLKNYCKVVFIPVANPYGMDKWATEQREGRRNYNNVNINRNYDTPGWAVIADSDKGNYAGDQNETQYIMNMCLDFEADIAIDIHCLGYISANNEGKCHWNAYIPNASLNNYITDVMLGYGLAYSSYGNASPSTNSAGSDWINFKGINGGLIEMNSGEFASSYNGKQHTSFIMEADYTLLLNVIRMWYYGVDPDMDFSKLDIK